MAPYIDTVALRQQVLGAQLAWRLHTLQILKLEATARLAQSVLDNIEVRQQAMTPLMLPAEEPPTARRRTRPESRQSGAPSSRRSRSVGTPSAVAGSTLPRKSRTARASPKLRRKQPSGKAQLCQHSTSARGRSAPRASGRQAALAGLDRAMAAWQPPSLIPTAAGEVEPTCWPLIDPALSGTRANGRPILSVVGKRVDCDASLNRFGTTHLRLKGGIPRFAELPPGPDGRRVAVPLSPKFGSPRGPSVRCSSSRTLSAPAAPTDTSRTGMAATVDRTSDGTSVFTAQDMRDEIVICRANGYHAVWAQMQEEKHAAEAEEAAEAEAAARAQIEYRVVFRGISLRDVPNADAKGGSDPFVLFTLLNCEEVDGAAPECRTQPMMNTASPAWTESVQLRVPPGCPAAMSLLPLVMIQVGGTSYMYMCMCMCVCVCMCEWMCVCVWVCVRRLVVGVNVNASSSGRSLSSPAPADRRVAFPGGVPYAGAR